MALLIVFGVFLIILPFSYLPVYSKPIKDTEKARAALQLNLDTVHGQSDNYTLLHNRYEYIATLPCYYLSPFKWYINNVGIIHRWSKMHKMIEEKQRAMKRESRFN